VTFDEDVAHWKSREEQSDTKDEERKHVAPMEEVTGPPMSPSHSEDHEILGPCEPMDPMAVVENRQRIAWLKSILQDAEEHAAT